MNQTIAAYPEVLLVESDVRDARIIRECLREAAPGRIHLEHARTLEQARERLGRGGIGVVLLDLGMPGSCGLETIRRLGLEASSVPFVILTNMDSDEFRAGAAALGADDYLVKNDVDGARLLESLKHAFKRQVEPLRSNGSGADPEVQAHESLCPGRAGSIDDAISASCAKMVEQAGERASFKFKARAAGAQVERPERVAALVDNLILGILARTRQLHASDVAFQLKSFRCGSRVAIAMVVVLEGCPHGLGTTLLEPFLRGDESRSSSAAELVLAADLLKRLHGQIRFGNRPGSGPWLEIMLPVAAA